jgi:hypothetical protein
MAAASVFSSVACDVDQVFPPEFFAKDDEVDDVVFTSWDVAEYSFCWRSEKPTAATVTITVTSRAIHFLRQMTPR